MYVNVYVYVCNRMYTSVLSLHTYIQQSSPPPNRFPSTHTHFKVLYPCAISLKDLAKSVSNGICVYACMYVCMYVCMHVGMYLYVYVHMYGMYVCMCVCVCIYVCMYLYVYVCIHECMCIYALTYLHSAPGAPITELAYSRTVPIFAKLFVLHQKDIGFNINIDKQSCM